MAGIMTVRAPEHIQKLLTEYANRRGITRNALILQIIWEWIKENEKNS